MREAASSCNQKRALRCTKNRKTINTKQNRRYKKLGWTLDTKGWQSREGRRATACCPWLFARSSYVEVGHAREIIVRHATKSSKPHHGDGAEEKPKIGTEREFTHKCTQPHSFPKQWSFAVSRSFKRRRDRTVARIDNATNGRREDWSRSRTCCVSAHP